MNSPSSPTKIWLGYLFVAYALFCLALPFALQHWWPSQIPTPVEKAEPVEAPKPAPPKAPPVDIAKMKQAFYQKLLPAIRKENQRIAKQRARLAQLQQTLAQPNTQLDPQQQGLLHTLALQYRVPVAMTNGAALQELLVRVDEVPASMALAQAAMESAWGRSRFAKEANNYFGQWCFSKGCGVVPKHRAEGASHEVASFASIDEAVAAYMRNLNSHPAYAEVRQQRLLSRQEGRPIDSLTMILGLENYSARGEAYIEELHSMIEFNRLKQFDHAAVSESRQVK